MSELEQTGVDEIQGDADLEITEGESTGSETDSSETGEEQKETTAAGPEEKVEQAFAKRLAAEREKIEKQYSPYKTLIETEAAKYNMTSEQYLAEVEKQRQETERQKYLEQGIDPDVITGLIDRHPAVQQAKQYTRELQLTELKGQPFFEELEPDIRKLMNDPNVDAKTAYKFLRGERMEELLQTERERVAKETEQKLIQSMQEKRKGKVQAGAVNSITPQVDASKHSIRDLISMAANDIEWSE